jgi:pimeloyl-ACP methyl ester carboxylesterase
MAFTAEDMLELRARLEADQKTTEERTEIEGGEVIRYVPEFVRKDEGTGEDALPLVFVRGMGAAEALPWYLKELAQTEQRAVIGIQYGGRLKGSARTVESEEIEGSASEIDFKQAADLTEAMEKLGISKADMVAESRGAIRAVLAMRQRPDLFRNVVLDHPAGQDDRNYRQAHVDAAREQVRRIKDHDQNELPVDVVAPEKQLGFLTRFRNARKEQKSVARARLHEDLAKLSPDIHVVVTGDHNDAAFIPERLRQTAQSAQEAGANVEFAETNWGGHGYRYSLEAVKETANRLREMERRSKS